MARRNTMLAGYRNSDQRSSIGDSYVAEAINDIARLQQRAVATMVSYDHTLEQTLPMLFKDEDLDKLRAVVGLVEPASLIENYAITHKCQIYFNFDHARIVPPVPEALNIQPGRVGPLMAAINAIKEVHMQYEEVKGLLRWLNRYATPGAIRFYFPPAMKLCPNAPIWKDLADVPARYSVPTDITAWAPVIKNATNTLAASAMLPAEAVARRRNTMWLTFVSEAVHLDALDPNKLSYSTDQVIYNL